MVKNIKKEPKVKLEKRLYDIIAGADEGDFGEVDAALDENPKAISFQEPSVGLTALHVAAADGNLDMVNHLLSKPGVNPNIVDKFGRQALDMAIYIGHDGVIEVLSRHMYPRSFNHLENGSASQPFRLIPKPKPD